MQDKIMFRKNGEGYKLSIAGVDTKLKMDEAYDLVRQLLSELPVPGHIRASWEVSSERYYKIKESKIAHKGEVVSKFQFEVWANGKLWRRGPEGLSQEKVVEIGTSLFGSLEFRGKYLDQASIKPAHQAAKEQKVDLYAASKGMTRKQLIEMLLKQKKEEAELEQAKTIIENAKKALGDDLRGFSVIDLLLDNMSGLSSDRAREIVGKLLYLAHPQEGES